MYPASFQLHNYPPLSKPHPRTLPETRPCFESYVRRTLAPLGATRIQAEVSTFNTFRKVSPSTARPLLVKKQRVTEGVKILLDIAKESSDWFPPLAAVLGGVNTLIRHHEVLVEWTVIVHG